MQLCAEESKNSAYLEKGHYIFNTKGGIDKNKYIYLHIYSVQKDGKNSPWSNSQWQNRF